MCKRLVTVALSVGALVAAAAADDPVSSRWQKLVDSKQCAEAETLCTQWSSSADVSTRVEGYKFLANVALSGQDVIFAEGDDRRGATISGSFKPEAIDKAIGFLNQGLKLAPQDLEWKEDGLHESKCVYAVFVEQKLHDLKRACELQQLDCEPEKQTACAAPAK